MARPFFCCMSILIISYKNDIHALAAQWALHRSQAICELFHYERYPLDTTLAFDGAEIRYRSHGGEWIDFGAFSTIWNRRAMPPQIPGALDPADRKIAALQARRFLDGLRLIRKAHQTWINDRLSQLQADSKPYQLYLAGKFGMKIPETLISNDPEAVRAFISAHDQAVCKPLAPMQWDDNPDEPLILPTSPVGLDDVEDDLSVSACAMIYQRNIRKKYELRVVVWGDEVLTCRIDSQTADESAQDWRMTNPSELKPEEIETPDEIRHFVQNMMMALGILHASFDFAVDQDDSYVFFELNEQGQTLWLEEVNPKIRVLDRIAAFLKRPRPDFRWSGQTAHAFGDFLQTDISRLALQDLEIENPYDLQLT